MFVGILPRPQPHGRNVLSLPDFVSTISSVKTAGPSLLLAKTQDFHTAVHSVTAFIPSSLLEPAGPVQSTSS